MTPMSNARAAVHAYRALQDRATATTFRRFGYHASADVLERRAERHEREAEREEADSVPPAHSFSSSSS